MYRGKPAADCELQIVDADDQSHSITTSSAGAASFADAPKGRWQVRAKMVDDTAGTVGDQKYSEKRYYCTLVIGVKPNEVKSDAVQSDAVQSDAAQSDAAQAEGSASKKDTDSPAALVETTPFPELPIGITSFGGAVVGHNVYVFGGHCGDAHDYYRSGQNSKLMRLDLKTPKKWETVSESTGLQGLAMVQHGGNLYRVGGFEARNKQGDEQDLHSLDQFARFDFDSGKWVNLAPLPSPRSSLDAVVIGDELFVVGGWTMNGDGDTKWCDDMVCINLKEKDAQWKTIKTPFKRRALSAGFQGKKLYAIGGMQSKGGPTRKVSVYGPEVKRVDRWS